MTEYTVELSEECGGSKTLTIEADSIDEAHEMAEDALTDWVRGGDYGDEGAAVEAYYTLRDEDGDEIDDRRITVDIEPNHAALIRAAGGDPDCDHDWTSEGEGGCTENPGVWSGDGTALIFAEHCRKCGLHRRSMSTGSQRNPGEHDTVQYTQPESWCPECECENCECEETEEN